MTSFFLKLIAVICMSFDHIGDAFFGHFTYFNLIGRIAFPIFAYQAVQGYMHTKDLKKHLIKLFIFACISQIPFYLFLTTFSEEFYLNILFTFLLGLITLFAYDECKNKFLGFLFVILGAIIGEVVHVDYGAFGILLIFTFYFFEKEFKDNSIKLWGNFYLSSKKFLMTILVCFLCFTKYISQIISHPKLIVHYLLLGLFTSLSMVFILFYNKKEGPKSKYFFYIFYPLHLLILYLVHIFI